MKISTIGLGNLGYPLCEFLSLLVTILNLTTKIIFKILYLKNMINSIWLYQLINNGNDVEFYYDISKL